MIKLIIADDDFKVRSAINLLLEQDKSCWQVIAEARSVKELFLKVRKEKPELLLLDWELPEENLGENAPPYYCLKKRIAYLKQLNPAMYIIVLSSEPQVKGDALQAGADQFVSKGDPPEFFLKALYEICEKPSAFFATKSKKKKIKNNNLDKILL